MRASSMKDKITVNKRTVLWNLLMILLMFGGAILVPVLKEGGHAFSPSYLGFSGVLAVAASVYVCCFESKITERFLFWLVPLVYVISVAFLLLFEQPFEYPFWTFGGLLLLCAFQLRYGVFLNLFLLFVIGSMQTTFLSEALIVQAVCLLLLGFIMPYVKGWKDVVNVLVSVAATLISVRVIFYLTTEKETLTGDIFSVAVVYFLVVSAVLLLSKFLKDAEWFQEQNENFDFLEELAAGAEGQEFDISEYMAVDETEFEVRSEATYAYTYTADDTVSWNMLSEEHAAQLEALASESAPLLVDFAQKCPKSFLHVRRVAIFASEVAEQLENVNVALVKCGGYYHEIGRLSGIKSVESTVEIAKQHDFPEALISVLREHTVDGDKPRSKEAGLILLTDNICGMCEHLRKTQKGRILVTKVIDRALNLRLAKGDLSQSGLTAKDLSVIRNALTDVMKEDMF